MFITSWIERIGLSLKQGSRRKSGRTDEASRACERLEERSLLSAQAFFLNGEIDITLGPTDSVAVRENPLAAGTVQVVLNGTPDANFPTVSASAVTRLLITGGDDANLIDLTGLTAAVFNNPALSIEAFGGNGADTLLGSDSLNDSLDGGHGTDSIVGNGGNDTLLGDDGNDSITGGTGNDSISAGDGQDTVDGGTGNDTIVAGDGEDLIDGSAGTDSIEGGDGADTLRGGDDSDILNGNAGTDVVNGQNGTDTLFGGPGNDTLQDNTGSDLLDGGTGNDVLDTRAVTLSVDNVQLTEGNTGTSQLTFTVALSSPVPTSVTVDYATSSDGTSTGGTATAGLDYTATSGPLTFLPGQVTQQVSVIVFGETLAEADETFFITLSNSVNAVIFDGSGEGRILNDDAATVGGLQPTAFPGGGTVTPTGPHFFSTGTGDASVTLGVDGYGTYGSTNGANGDDALYDPVGPIPQSGTTWGSALAFRVGNTGTREFLSAGTISPYASGGLPRPTITGTTTDSISSFSRGGLNFSLAQSVDPLNDNTGVRAGSLLTQTYTITNPTGTPISFELIRYMEGDLNFSGIPDGGGRLVTAAGDELMFETDVAGAGGANTTFVGISGIGGTAPTTNRFELNTWTGLGNRILAGNPLGDLISGDGNGDQFVDAGNDADVGVALRNTFNLAAGATTTYTTHTLFGTGAPNNIGTTPAAPPPPAPPPPLPSSGDNDTLLGGTGNDTLNGADGNDLLNGGAGDDVLDGANGNDSMLGGNGNDVLIGGDGDDTGKGQSGSDTLTGTAGADVMDGGAGNDVVSGGTTTVPVLMSIDNISVLEGTGGINFATFAVSLSSASASPVTVDYTTVSGSAVASSDFSQTSGTLTIAPGQTTGSISVSIVTDSVDEFNESFTVVLSNASGATINDGIGLAAVTDDDGPASVVAAADALTLATSYVSANASSFGITADDAAHFVVTDQYVSEHNGVTHVYLQQTYQGLTIVDATINVNVMADGSILSANSSFVGGVESLNLSAVPGMTSQDVYAVLDQELANALAADPYQYGTTNIAAEQNSQNPQQEQQQQPPVEQPILPLQLNRTSTPDRLQWAKTEDGGLELVWTINVQTRSSDGDFGWYDASMNASTGEVVGYSSWISNASYNVINGTDESPLYVPRTIQVDPQDATASPFGWHDTNGVAGPEFTDTRGNNVFAQSARDDDPIFDLLFTGNAFGSGPRPDGGAALNFDFAFDDTQDPSTYLSAATANLFYVNNIIHDIFYQYGFDEASGNFQFNNYGNGGLGNDQVGANAQAGANVGYFDNAFMATPPDGQNPLMAMFLWDLTNPNLDGDFDNGIIIHEYGHGVSNRLTGGPGNSNALNSIQSRGMGEGWSDWWALMFTQNSGDLADDRRPIGNYVLGQSTAGGGIRRFPYSFDMSVDPLTFANYNGGFPNNDVYNIGQIWASTLWDMNWLLINGINTPDCEGNTTPGYGFDSDLYNGTGGNNLAMQLVMDGLKLQPANPTFTQARDAILQADLINNGGANSRQIWTAFARRGLGFSANAGADANATTITPTFDLPPELGAVRLDAQVYQIGDQIGITVCDTDRAALTPTVNVVVTTTTGDSETVTLTRQANQLFTGTILVNRGTPTAGNGQIDIAGEADLITVIYTDNNDGTGQVATLQALAVIDAGQGDTLSGGDGSDQIIGGSGDDSINAGAGNDSAFGGGGNDSILGGAGADYLDGQQGDDTLAGQGGKDTLIGGEGNDTFQWSAAGDGVDEVSSLGGYDQMQVTATGAADTVTVGKIGPRIQITSGGNVLTINADIHVVSIDLGNGDDSITVGDLSGVSQTVMTINGGDGNDNLNAGAGILGDVRLRLSGDAGNDTITGSANDDTIDGGAGTDSLLGGTGADTIFGGTENDTISGQAGDDSITGDDGNDLLVGGDGNDTVRGGLGNDSLVGQAGDDSLDGAEGRDTLSGGDGNDSLDAGGGKDYLTGGNGDDTIDGGRNDDTILGDAGNDTIRGNHGNDSIDGGTGDDTISGGDGNDTVNGADGNDLLTGADGDDAVNGAAGNDTVTGGDGNDLIAGGAGSDVILGDDGDDTLKGNGGTNTIAGGQGNDTLVSLPTDVINDSFVLSDDLLGKLDLL